MRYVSQNFRLFHVSNLSILTFELFLPCIRDHHRPTAVVFTAAAALGSGEGVGRWSATDTLREMDGMKFADTVKWVE